MIGNKETKYIIVGSHGTNKYDVAELLDMQEQFSKCQKFTSDENEKDNKDILYLDNLEINNGYKNNAFAYIHMNKEGIFEGVTSIELYENNVLPLEISEFNRITDNVLSKYKVLIVWVDSSNKDNKYVYEDIHETNYLMERLKHMDYIYILNEDVILTALHVIEYERSDIERRKEIIKENF